MAEDGEIQISKHSSGVSILIRIDGLWKDANNHSRGGQFSKWNTDLDVIWRELARDFNNDDYEEEKKKFDEFDKGLVEIGRFNDNGSDTFNDEEIETINKRSKHYRKLNDKELFLKRLENKYGKGTTWSDGDEEDIE